MQCPTLTAIIKVGLMTVLYTGKMQNAVMHAVGSPRAQEHTRGIAIGRRVVSSVSMPCYPAVFSCNHLYSVVARLILPYPVATYNAALKLPKLAQWRLKWPPGVPLWPPTTVVGGLHFFYNVMIYGHITVYCTWALRNLWTSLLYNM